MHICIFRTQNWAIAVHMFIFRILLLRAQLLLVLSQATTVKYVSVKNNAVPTNGNPVDIECGISSWSTGLVYVYKLNVSGKPDITQESLYTCSSTRCYEDVGGYNAVVSAGIITINIQQLNRIRDEKWWSCIIYTTESWAQMNLKVYTVPAAVSLSASPDRDIDLSVEPVTLTCSTTNCVSPAPNFTYLVEYGGSSKQYAVSNGTINIGICTDKEGIYSSTLTLPVNTTYDNVNKNVKFQCSIVSFLGLGTPVNSSWSKYISFAVKVTSVILLNGTAPVAVNNSIITVANGTVGSLSCQPSFSKPIAMVVWYIGQNEVKRGIDYNYNLHFNDIDHSKPIYCRAFNILENEAVESYSLILNVTVAVSSVDLRERTSTPSSGSIITVTSGAPKTLYCVLGTNRPAATVRWYIDNVQQNISDTIFQFTPDDIHHNKQIYCTAFNLQSESQAVTSNRPSLYVRVNATTPSLLIYGNAGNEALLENETVSLVCNTSLTRPAANVKWTGITVLNVKSVTNQADRDFVWVTSTATYVPTRSDNNKIIVCETMIDGQETNASKQQNLEIWWPPFQPFVTELPTFPWTEGTTYRSLTCTGTGGGNPEATTISWNSPIGTQDPNNASRLMVNTVTYEQDEAVVSCQLDNGYTLRKAKPIKSDVKKLNINFSPKVLIENNNKRFTSQSGAMFNESVLIYSKPKDIVNIDIERLDNKTNRLNVTLISSSITVHVQGATVQRDGHISMLFINGVTDEDFGNYSVDVSNIVGTLEWHFVVQAESKPFPVKVVRYLGIINEVPTFYMESGFNGGTQQQFSVETSVDGNVWTERLRFNEYDGRFLQPNKTFIFGINGLEAGSYKVRVVASNTFGTAEQLEQSYVDCITVLNKDQLCKHSSNHTEAIITGVVSSVVVCVLTALISVVMTKRYMITAKEDKSHLYEGMKTERNVINLYDTLEQEREKHNVYANTEVTTT